MALDRDGIPPIEPDPEPERDEEPEEPAPVPLGPGAWFVETPRDFRGVRWI